MGFFKKDNIPSELPDLAVNPTKDSNPNVALVENSKDQNIKPSYQKLPDSNALVNSQTVVNPEKQVMIVERPVIQTVPDVKLPVINGMTSEEIKKQIDDGISNVGPEQKSFFDKVLEDINGEIKDLGKLEDWYEKKFLPQDVVSNMRLYWEDNKADMIIKSFGYEYKQKINEKIKNLQSLEADWREIYFRLIKKEEDMKKEERSLKDTLSEFVELCKRRKVNG